MSPHLLTTRPVQAVLASLTFLLASVTAAGEITTVAGTGQAKDNGAAGKACEINIGEPFGVEFGPDGALYVTEVRNHRVRRVNQGRRGLGTERQRSRSKIWTSCDGSTFTAMP